jgi:CheY-like chemotaxis protein
MGRKILADAGYEVITVNNGSAALKKIGEQRPDLIVLDVYMPGYSGLEVCQRLKEAGETSRIPVLLTVGKLEPFKPEEAKRVRADGFIVKPFEASELLSALTRLEDKIVPRNESSKPGRFARAVASDDGRFDKTMVIEQDSGWKNRISFPAKKKAKEAEPEEPEVAKPASKDLRGVAEQAAVHAPSHQKPEGRVDLGALAPVGLPKDVTPEEIAALAAAAARMKGKIAEEVRQDASAEMPVVPPPPSEEQSQAPSSADFSVAEMPGSAAVTLAAQADTKEIEAKDTWVPQDAGVIQSAYSDGKVEVETSGSAKEPFTMAAAAGESGSTTARWTAVSVALAPEDAAISLEQEMQKAYAVYAAAESGHTGSASMTAPTEIGIAPQNTVPEEAVSVPATIAPEAAQTLSAVASAAADAVSAAVKELENVASSYAAQAFTPIETTAPSAPEIPTDKTEHAQSSSEAPAATTEIPHTGNNESESQEAADPELIAETTAKTLPALDSAYQEKNAEGPAAATEVHSEVVAASSSELPDNTPEPAHKESEIAEISPSTSSTQVSESGNGHHSPAEAEASPAVAMAAAVAGQKILEEAQAEDSDIEIASIVDSVLANLRPKIVEEISRKLGKR